jgi:tRNA pseudouridine38-40 synthase
MATYQSIIAYDGTDFRGFQRLPGARSVQGVLEDALTRLGWAGSSLLAAGRTDAGVHARGQVVSYRLDWTHGPDVLTRALNADLPSDVAVRETALAAEGFHPRFSARRRRYRYSIGHLPAPDPTRERFAWRVWPPLDLALLQVEASALEGRKDFGPFGRAPIPGGHTIRQVFRAAWTETENGLAFDIEADAFLYRMVRRLVAAMIAVGAGRAPAGSLSCALEAPERAWQGKPAPARGLCLEAVIYEDKSPELSG